ncbi:MAG: SpoIID/LytB domain-containing protein [candidate division NC10 bacterium]|nr:SpoIID/LytB domain-containing protein [candidate division NC10 bacterium]
MPPLRFLWFAFFSLSLLCPLPPSASAIEVRVLIVESATHLTLSSPSSLKVFGCASSYAPRRYAPQQRIRISYDPGGLTIGGERVACYQALSIESEPSSPIQVDNRSYRGRVEIYRENGKEGLFAVNVLEMEEYLRGVIREEISPEWPLEALKAQAIVARTFALRQLLDNPQHLFHLKSTTDSQLYGGRYGEDHRTDLAVKETAGLVLTFRKETIPAFYHAACGGHTEDAADVWSYNHSSLQGVACAYCKFHPVYTWQARLRGEEIRRSLARWGYEVGEVEAILPLLRSKTHRILQIEIRHALGRTLMEGKRFRQCLGYDLIRSTNFSVKRENGSFLFSGKGWGHGVGLCQWGAKGMADRAFRYEEILKHYYPGTVISRMEEVLD